MVRANGHTSGPEGVDPTALGDSSQSSESGPRSEASSMPDQPGLDPLRGRGAPSGRTGASFRKPAEPKNARAAARDAAIAATREQRDRRLSEEGRALRHQGFSADQIDEIVAARSEIGDAGEVFSELPNLFIEFSIDTINPQLDKPQQELFREQLVILLKAGGADALDALRHAYFNSTGAINLSELCGLLHMLGTAGRHSYKQLAAISRVKADALPVLREIHEELEVRRTLGTTDTHHNATALQQRRELEEESGALSSAAMQQRANRLGVLASRGGVEALKALQNVALTGNVPSTRGFDDELTDALRATGLKPREIERL